MLDKRNEICYNINVARGNTKPTAPKKNLKKIKKSFENRLTNQVKCGIIKIRKASESVRLTNPK